MAGPDLKPSDLGNAHVLGQYAKNLRAQSGNAPIAILYHDAQEFSLTSVKGPYTGPDNFASASLVLLDSPARVIDENPLPDSSYGLVHLQGAKKSLAVRLSSSSFKGFEALAISHPEFRVGVYSAPLEFLSGIPWLFEDKAIGDPKSGIAIIVTYEKFGFLALINELGLQAIVSVPATERLVEELLDRVQTSMHGCGITKAVLSTFDYTGSPAIQTALDGYFESNQEIGAFIHGDAMIFDREALLDACAGFAGQAKTDVRLEMLDASKLTPKIFAGDAAAKRMVDAARFNFNRAARSAATQRLSFFENLGIAGSWILWFALVLSIVAGTAAGAYSAYKTINSPAWKLDRAVAQNAALEALRLKSIRDSAQAWDAILKPRSQAWSVLEFASLLFPEKTGIVLDNLDYNLAPAAPSPNQPPPDPLAGPPKVKLVRTWTLSGYAPAAATPYIESLNTEAARLALKKIATISQDSSLDPLPGSIEVRPERKPADESDRIAFSIVITQTLPDALSFPTAAPQLPDMSQVLKPASIPSAL